MNGYFVSNPAPRPADVSLELIANTQRLVKEFSQFLLTVTKSIEDDGEIEADEADRIRERWETFKGTVEAFAVACEQGIFRTSGNGG